jgi:hypothetical protein
MEPKTADGENRKIHEHINMLFPGKNIYDSLRAAVKGMVGDVKLTTINLDSGYALTYWENNPYFDEYRLDPSGPRPHNAITYFRVYRTQPDASMYRTSDLTVYGFETDHEATEGIMTEYKSLQQFLLADGAQVGTQPPGSYSQLAYSQPPPSPTYSQWGGEGREWSTVKIDRITGKVKQGGRRKTRHRRRKTHRRKTRRSRR